VGVRLCVFERHQRETRYQRLMRLEQVAQGDTWGIPARPAS
jgi:hypothetical protein